MRRGLTISNRIDLLPLLCLGMIILQLDRMNIASALTGFFGEDTSVDQSTINLGNQMMFIGIIVLGVPSNMLLQRVCIWPIDYF